MKPNEVRRREVVTGLAISPATLLPVASLAAPPVWKPRLFSPAQVEMVATLAEIMIPQTDTPGARAALVHEHIDLVLSEESAEVRQRFFDELAWVDATSQQRYQLSFVRLDSQQQVDIVTAMSRPGSPGHQFFLDFRRRTVFAYYTSETGLRQELNYQGHQILESWPGCPHPDHHGDEA